MIIADTGIFISAADRSEPSHIRCAELLRAHHDIVAGSLGFIVVRGFIDARSFVRDGTLVVEFYWEGRDEGDPVCGRGIAELQPDGSLSGRIFFHMGDDSGFAPTRAQAR